MGPADKGLSRPPPGPKVSRNGAPLGAVLMSPKDSCERAPQILGRGLALGPALLDQRLQPPPLCVRQHRSSSPGKVTWEGAKCYPSEEVQGRTGPSIAPPHPGGAKCYPGAEVQGRTGPSLAAPDLTGFPRPPGTFASRLPAGRSPFPPLDMTTTATGLLRWRDLSPAGMAASLAAPDPVGGG